MAIQTSSDEDGQKVSFVYPKKSNEVSITFNSHELSQHKFDFSGIFKRFTKIFSKKFNFFLQSTTTTESPENNSYVDENEKEQTFSPEDQDLSSSTTEDQEFSSSTTEDYESSSAGSYEYPIPEITSKNADNFFTADTSESYETVPLVYLPPSRSPLSTYLQKEETPFQVYLPTN